MPALVTVIDVVVAPVLHNRDPEKPEAVNNELPQLFVTVTTGAVGIAFTVSVAGEEFTVPAVLVQTARYCRLFKAGVAVTFNVPEVAPEMFVQVVPFVLSCHCMVGAGLPVALELKVTWLLLQTAWDCGCNVITGAVPASAGTNTTSAQ